MFSIEQPSPVVLRRCDGERARAAERIQQQVSGFGRKQYGALEQGERLLRRMLAGGALRLRRHRELPEVPHLLAAVHFLGVPVVERPAGRLRRRFVYRPDDLLGALRQRARSDVRLRVRLEPHHRVEDAALEHVLEDEAELVDVVVRAEDEDVPVRLDDARDFAQPRDVELVEFVLGEGVPRLRHRHVRRERPAKPGPASASASGADVERRVDDAVVDAAVRPLRHRLDAVAAEQLIRRRGGRSRDGAGACAVRRRGDVPAERAGFMCGIRSHRRPNGDQGIPSLSVRVRCPSKATSLRAPSRSRRCSPTRATLRGVDRARRLGAWKRSASRRRCRNSSRRCTRASSAIAADAT